MAETNKSRLKDNIKALYFSLREAFNPKTGKVSQKLKELLKTAFISAIDGFKTISAKIRRQIMSKETKGIQIFKWDQIIDHWLYLIKNAKGRGREVIEKTKEGIEALQPPGVKYKVKIVSTGWFKLIFKKKKQETIVITNKKLKHFRMYVGVRDYGVSLIVSWYLTVKLGFFRRFLSILRKYSFEEMAMSRLDFIDHQELSAYVTCIHHSLIDATQELVSAVGQDPQTIDRKSKGFLGIS